MWLKGDKNSRFFHASLKVQRNINVIKCLEDNGQRLADPSAIGDHITAFYSNLFNQNLFINDAWEFNQLITKLSKDDIESLCKWVTVAEVEEVVMEANIDKVPSPDGFNGLFFKENWSLINDDVSKAISSFNTGKLLKEVNRTFLTLIPKGENTKSIKDYRPISLCNFLYKIISKILVKRLRRAPKHHL